MPIGGSRMGLGKKGPGSTKAKFKKPKKGTKTFSAMKPKRKKK